MIEKMKRWTEVEWYDTIDKINEIIDYVNDLACLHKMFEAAHNHSKPVGTLAKLEMHKATLQDLEEEIRRGSIE